MATAAAVGTPVSATTAGILAISMPLISGIAALYDEAGDEDVPSSGIPLVMTDGLDSSLGISLPLETPDCFKPCVQFRLGVVKIKTVLVFQEYIGEGFPFNTTLYPETVLTVERAGITGNNLFTRICRKCDECN